MVVNRRSLLTFIVLAFCLNVTAYAWDDVGHKLTTYIAWEVMTPEAREKAARLLLKAPEDSDLSVVYTSFSTRSENSRRLELFMYASTWPDVVRDRNFEVRNAKYHQGNWHYGAIFWEGQGTILADFPEPSGVAIPKLYEFEKILRDPGYKDGEKAIALAWFLHVAGDLHNPLHNASRVSASEPKGDQGGNLFILEPEKADGSWRMNLHSYWDSSISRTIRRKNDQCDQDYVGRIGRKFIRKHPVSGLSSRFRLGEYTAWNDEGFRLLPTGVYGNGLERETLPSKKYGKMAFRLSREQITLAGYRIGMTLNDIFAESPENGSSARWNNTKDDPK